MNVRLWFAQGHSRAADRTAADPAPTIARHPGSSPRESNGTRPLVHVREVRSLEPDSNDLRGRTWPPNHTSSRWAHRGCRILCEDLPVTTPSIVPDIPGLTFTCYDVSQIGSISGLFPARAGRCGIYVLLFDDGSVYGGQAEDVVSRFANHRRTWLPRNIVGLRFSPCSEKDLDRLEQLTVTWLEVQGHNLQNKMLTGKPGGHGVVAVTLVTGEVVHLPWNRADRAPQ